MAKKTNTPNLFIVLELDPTKRWDQAEFERQLRQKRQEWSRLVNLPTKKGLAAKRNLGAISELRKIAADEALRQAQAKEAGQQKAGTKRDQLNEFDEQLKLLQLKGHLLEPELQRLIKQFAAVLSEKEIRKRIKVPIKKEQTTTRSRQATLDSSKAKDIRTKLEQLAKADLYEFLGMGAGTERSLLLKRAKTLYDGVQKKASKTPDDTLTSELSGYCLDIFKSDAERAKYDETVRLQDYQALIKKVDQMAAVSKKIEAQQMAQLLRNAKGKKLNPAEAQAMIIKHAANKGYAVFVAEQTKQTVEALQVCGYCSAVNDATIKHCTTCGEALQEACPKCRKIVASSEMACGACGFPNGNRVWVRVLLNEAEQTCLNRDYDAASGYLQQAKQAWPATGSDRLTSKIAVLEAQIAPQREKQEALVKQIESAIRQKQFYAARALLPQLERRLAVGSDKVHQYRRQIEPKIRQAEAKLAQARRVKASNPEEVVRLYQEVLAICQDCEEAQQKLANIPPSPPTSLRATLGGKVINLTWRPTPSQAARYIIVRKTHSRPISVNDGRQLATINGTVYDDEHPEIGVPLFYAVFADRAGVASQNGAMLMQPIMMVQDVRNVVKEVKDQQIELQWTPPPNVSDVVVRRSMKAYPRSPQDGQSVPTLGQDKAIDRRLVNERKYFYTIFSLFKDYQGQLQRTVGVRIEATPQPPPTPIHELQISMSGPSHNRQLELSWVAPFKGQVVILKSNQPSRLEANTIIDQKEVVKYGQLLATRANQLKVQVEQLGFYYFLPVVMFEGMGYVGQEHKYVCVDDVSDLSVQNLGHLLRLQWRWPSNCQEVLVAYSYQGWPTPHQPDSTTIPLMRAQYDLYGHYDIANPIQADHYITVFAVISQAGQKIVAGGANQNARKRVSLMSRITLSYEIKNVRVKWFKKKLTLQLKIKGQGTMPTLVLTRKQSTLPLNKFDGEMITIPSQPISEERLVIDLPEQVKQRQRYGKLFLENDDLYDMVTIRHPSLDKLRLF